MESTADTDLNPGPAMGRLLSRLWAAFTCWVMAALFVVAWWWPRSLDNGRWVKLGVGMMVLEFILVHSGALIGSVATRRGTAVRARALIGLGLLYTLFGVVIAFSFRSWEILASFAAVMSGRFWLACSAEGDGNTDFGQGRAAASIALYLGLTFATILIPIPRGGITPELLDEVWRTRGSGLWERRPEVALAMGAAYFLLLGVIEAKAPSVRPGSRGGP